jgi:hypothetical protein
LARQKGEEQTAQKEFATAASLSQAESEHDILQLAAQGQENRR